MCGRFINDSSVEELCSWLDASHIEAERPESHTARFNIAPSQTTLCLRAAAKAKTCSLSALRFGVKREPTGLLINARAETARKLPTFRNASQVGRCVVVATGFFEWQVQKEGRKQPFLFRQLHRRVFGFAGLVMPDDSFVIITTQATDQMAPIHKRMPVMLDPKNINMWLDPSTPAETAFGLTHVALQPQLFPTPLDGLVNNPRNDGPDILRQVRVALPGH